MPLHQELKDLAGARLRDAEILFDNGRNEAAAYMCGYVLEMALKACICRRLRVPEYPPKKLKRDFKTHDFDDLLLLAGLSEELTVLRNPALFTRWSIVANWKREWRYEAVGFMHRDAVRRMLEALRDSPDGVLPWLKKRW